MVKGFQGAGACSYIENMHGHKKQDVAFKKQAGYI